MHKIIRKVRRVILHWISNSAILNDQLRVKYLRRLGMNIGAETLISENFFFEDVHINIGSGVYLNRSFKVYNRENYLNSLIIGDNVAVGPNCTIVTVQHDIGSQNRRASEISNCNVKICNGTWIGANTTILPGVTIGEGCVIAAGAVVVSDTIPNSLYAGVPAKLKKKYVD